MLPGNIVGARCATETRIKNQIYLVRSLVYTVIVYSHDRDSQYAKVLAIDSFPPHSEAKWSSAYLWIHASVPISVPTFKSCKPTYGVFVMNVIRGKRRA